MENTEYIELIMAQVGQLDKIADNLSDKYKTAKNILKEYLEIPLMLFEDSENYDLIANAEPFMFSENGEIVFWDIRESKDGEYPIYLANFPVGVYYAGGNFREFIINLTDKDAYKKILTFYEEPLLPKFRPLKMVQ